MRFDSSPLVLSPIHWSIINYKRRRFLGHSRHSMCWFKHKPAHINFTTKLVFWGVIKDLRFALGYCALADSLPATLAVGAARQNLSPLHAFSPCTSSPNSSSPPSLFFSPTIDLFFIAHSNSPLCLPLPLFSPPRSFSLTLGTTAAVAAAAGPSLWLSATLQQTPPPPTTQPPPFKPLSMHPYTSTNLLGLVFFHKQTFACTHLEAFWMLSSFLLS